MGTPGGGVGASGRDGRTHLFIGNVSSVLVDFIKYNMLNSFVI